MGTISETTGLDSIDGGAAIDSVVFASGPGLNVIVDLQVGNYTFNDFLLTGSISGVERVSSGEGEDRIAGNGDTTFIDAGEGDDEVNLATLSTEARGGDGKDVLDLRALGGPVGFDLSTATLQTGFESLSLTSFADVGTGSEADNDLFGSGGNDTLFGLNGKDRLFGGDDNDRLDGGADTLNGDNGRDTLEGGAGLDTLNGGLGSDTYIVDGTDDTIIEGVGEGKLDTVRTSVTYILASDVEIERLIAGSGGINLTGNAFAQSITGNTGANHLSGAGGADTLNGGSGADTLSGGEGADRLTGGRGNDVLVGEAGADTLTGGSEWDSFVFSGAFGNDTVSDFDRLEPAERIDITAITAIVDFADLVANHLTQGATGAVVTIGLRTITLTGVLATDLQADDFWI